MTNTNNKLHHRTFGSRREAEAQVMLDGATKVFETGRSRFFNYYRPNPNGWDVCAVFRCTDQPGWIQTPWGRLVREGHVPEDARGLVRSDEEIGPEKERCECPVEGHALGCQRDNSAIARKVHE